jgi:hypothetical protein
MQKQKKKKKKNYLTVNKQKPVDLVSFTKSSPAAKVGMKVTELRNV